MRKAVYTGSFDPITNGHLWLIEKGAELFDEVVVAIGTNPDKSYMFTLEERVDMLRESTSQFKNIEIDTFQHELAINYARRSGATFILRGIRSQSDYEYEKGMRHVNADQDPEIMTVFLIPSREVSEISSSLIKGMVGMQGWEEIVKKYVPKPVYDEFLKRVKEKR